jgi:hypothetical protein
MHERVSFPLAVPECRAQLLIGFADEFLGATRKPPERGHLYTQTYGRYGGRYRWSSVTRTEADSRGQKNMSGVRVLVGTEKCAFVLTSDGKRQRWELSSPHFVGWEIYHLAGSIADPNRLYASQYNSWLVS